uniref:Baculoviral IAP repeat-containing protein 5 n=1 Tax=Equus caballus TaxID=9796 RepID=F6TQ61_HORSE
MPRGGRQPPDLNRGSARRPRDGRPVVAPSLAAVSQGPPRLYLQELALLGGLRLHSGAGETARPPGAPSPTPPRGPPRGDPPARLRGPRVALPAGLRSLRGGPGPGGSGRAPPGPDPRSPLQMAAAGFIHCPTENEPDLAQCFFCFKELEGWEPDDDPIEEHKKHSSGCAFLSVKKQFEELTLSEFLKLDKERAKNKIAKETNNKQKEFEETAKKVRYAIEQLAALE